MKPKQLWLPNTISKQSNILCRARIEKACPVGFRVAVMIASMIKETDEEFHEYEIKPSVLSEYNLSQKDVHRMQKAMGDIASTTVSILEGTKYHSYPLFGCASYDSKTGKATVMLNPVIKDHYLQLHKYYTQVPVLEYVRLTTTYTQKLFEFLLSWKTEYQKTIEINELYELLNVPELYRQNFADFRRKILDPSCKQLKKKTSLYFEYEALAMEGGRGKGKKKTHVNFIFNAEHIQKMKTPYYRFQTLPKTRQKALHKEFLATFDSVPEGIKKSFTWLKSPASEIYLNSFKVFLKDHKDFQKAEKEPLKCTKQNIK